MSQAPAIVKFFFYMIALGVSFALWMRLVGFFIDGLREEFDAEFQAKLREIRAEAEEETK